MLERLLETVLGRDVNDRGGVKDCIILQNVAE